MESFIEQNDILSPSQYGFCKAHSTQHAILDMVSTTQQKMGKSLFSCGVFIDLKKAFTTVDHKIILHKLVHYGFCRVINKWFSSLLEGRTQTTQIGSYISLKKKYHLLCAARLSPMPITLPNLCQRHPRIL